MGQDDDLDRRAILERRKRFVAAALGGMALACGASEGPAAQPCLDVEPTRLEPQGGEDEDAGVEPQPCLDMPMAQDEDAGVPQPCLEVMAQEPHPEPQPCLDFAAPPSRSRTE